MTREIEIEDEDICQYCGDSLPENELRMNLDNGRMCSKCWNIAKIENPELVEPVYTAKDFDNRAIYFNPNAPRKQFTPLSNEELRQVLA
jgi:hypothetical protein